MNLFGRSNEVDLDLRS